MQADAGPPQGRPAASRHDAARVGRRVAFVIIGLLGVWVIGAGFRSVIPQVFWPAASVPQEDVPCGPALEALTAALEESAEVRPEPVRRERLRAWDRRYFALDRACHTQPAYDALYRTRHAAETQAARHDDHLAPLLDEVRGSGDRR